MPELPEVETIKLGLQKYAVGHRIKNVEVRLSKILSGETKNIIGAKILQVERFGKGLVIKLDNQYSIAIHIKLTGQFIYRDAKLKGSQSSRDKVGTMPNKWTHVIFYLDKGALLYYNDLRQFGWIKIIRTDEITKLPFFKELGPEFLKDLTLVKFTEILNKSKTIIKPLLLDQKKMSGVGNIYANDGLFESGIDPRRKAFSLSNEEAKRLYYSIQKVLKKGLEYGGATELNFVNILGQEGKYQNHFLVYGRQGEKCHRCPEKIKKIKLAGRGTYFCPHCQR